MVGVQQVTLRCLTMAELCRSGSKWVEEWREAWSRDWVLLLEDMTLWWSALFSSPNN